MKVKLTDLCDIQYGYAFDSANFTDDESYIPLVRIRDVKRGFSETYYSGEYPPEYILHAGDLLIGMDGEFNIARWKSKDALLNQRVCKVSAKDGVCEEYIRFVLSKELKAIENRTAFVTVKHLSAKELNKLEIDIPDLLEQERVSDSLVRIEEIISKRQIELQKFDELINARFVELFGDPVLNENGWNQLTLGDICEIGSSKRVYEKDYVSQGIPFFRTKEIVELSKGNQISTELFISEEHFKKLKDSYGVPCRNDLLISAVGTIGTIWIVNDEFDFYFKDGNIIQIKSNETFNSVYMKYLLDELIANYKKEMSTGTAYAALTIVGLKKMQVYDVPLEVQNDFAAFVEQVDKSKFV